MASREPRPRGVVRRELYWPTLQENIATFLEGIALRCSRRKTLIVGPYVGEFGHEIMDFQSYVRWFKRKYPEIHVITFPGREPLYRGCTVHTHPYDLKTAGYIYGRITHNEITDYVRNFAAAHHLKGYDAFSTRHLRTRWHRRLLFRQAHEVIQPLSPVPENQKVLFHFRNIDKAGPDKSRNFRADLAAEVCALCQAAGYETACIGHPQYALCPPGCEDHRSGDLEKTVAQIAASRILVGEQSGPLHLAVYCAKPVVIWAPDQWRIDGAMKRNPFRVRIFVVRSDTTNPAPEEVVGKIQDALGVLASASR